MHTSKSNTIFVVHIGINQHLKSLSKGMNLHGTHQSCIYHIIMDLEPKMERDRYYNN